MKKEENIKNIKANKEEFMTVGQIAKKMNVTVRTLQFYDKKDILKPSAESEGGRRLYTSKDVVKLDQIIALKQLGFSLEDIKGRLPNLDSPEEVVEVLRSQSEGIRQQVNTLMEVLVQIEKLSAEITQMHVVDWSTYADILNLIREDNMNYKYLRFYSNKMKNYMRELDQEKAQYITEHNAITNKTATEYWKQGVDYKSKKAQKLAKESWDHS